MEKGDFVNNTSINEKADILKRGIMRKPIYANANPILGYSEQEIIDFYSNGNRGNFHWNFSDTKGVSPSAVEIGRKTGDVSKPSFKKRELAGGENLVS